MPKRPRDEGSELSGGRESCRSAISGVVKGGMKPTSGVLVGVLAEEVDLQA